MRIKVEPQGDFRDLAREEYLLLEQAVTGGVTRAGAGLQAGLRRQVVGAGLGRKLANAWRLNVYPKGGEVSASAAAVVATKAPSLIRAFDEGATIRSAGRLYLAIPSDAAPKKGVGGQRISPQTFPEWSLGKLRFVYSPPSRGPSMLVVDNYRVRKGKRGGFAPSRDARRIRSGKGLVTVVMFFLVPQVKLRKRLDVESVAAAAASGLPGMIDAEFARLDRS